VTCDTDIALVVGWHERVAALLLAGILIPATLTAHNFWAYHGIERPHAPVADMIEGAPSPASRPDRHFPDDVTL
jgi:uncharacterized membrane protein YphA (DoxX/SURF4 family)